MKIEIQKQIHIYFGPFEIERIFSNRLSIIDKENNEIIDNVRNIKLFTDSPLLNGSMSRPNRLICLSRH